MYECRYRSTRISLQSVIVGAALLRQEKVQTKRNTDRRKRSSAGILPLAGTVRWSFVGLSVAYRLPWCAALGNTIRLLLLLLPGRSMVDQAAVNRQIGCSSHPWGAITSWYRSVCLRVAPCVREDQTGHFRAGMFQGGDGPLQGPCGGFDFHAVQVGN